MVEGPRRESPFKPLQPQRILPSTFCTSPASSPWPIRPPVSLAGAPQQIHHGVILDASHADRTRLRCSKPSPICSPHQPLDRQDRTFISPLPAAAGACPKPHCGPRATVAMSSSTPCPSTRLASRTIPSPSSLFSTSPSTTKSSIFSSADSVLSTSPASPLSCTTFKRKHGRGLHEAKHGPKRRKVMGRPKNAWTPTRLRKLVRLYLMTNLKVTQIAKVLQAKDFHPRYVSSIASIFTNSQ